MIKPAIEKLIESLLSGTIFYSDNLKDTSVARKKTFTNLIEPSVHRCLEFVTIINGTPALQLDSTVANIQPNEVWSILPRTLHCEGFVGKKKSYVLLWVTIMSRTINFSLSEYNAASGNRLTTNRLFVESQQSKELWEISLNHMFSKSLLLQARFVSLFLAACIQALADASNVNNKSSEWAESHRKLVQQIKDYIQLHCREDLSIAELSGFAGYSPNHLSVLFRKYTNQSIHQYLIQIRLKLAKELLMTGDHQIKEVAYLAGFNDPLYFSRIFRKKFVQSPSEFLSSVRTNQPENTDSLKDLDM